MSNSIPEQRADSNGKTMTRHVSAPVDGSSEPHKRLPRALAPNDPKRMAREAMRRLKDNGLDLTDSTSQNAFLFYLAKVSPETLNLVVDSAASCHRDEKKMWLYYLGETFAPEKDDPRWSTMWLQFRYLDQLIPTANYLESTSAHAGYRYQAVKLISLAENAFPDRKEDPEFMRAAAIVLHLKGENRPFQNRKPDIDYSPYLPDIEYISERVDEVEKMIPLLRARNTTDNVVIASLLESESAPLTDGTL